MSNASSPPKSNPSQGPNDMDSSSTTLNNAIQSLPSTETLAKCFNVDVLDVKGEKIALGKLVDAEAALGRKTVVVLTRHFFCGSCQDYVANLASTSNATAFSEAKTSLIVIGCGDWQPIQFYAETTGFPSDRIFANPGQEIFTALNTKRTILTAPTGVKVKDYITVSLPMNVLRSFYRMFSSLSTAIMALKFQQGPSDQNGGELIFDHDKRCTYAHIMRHAQDHTEVYDLMKLAGVESRS